MQKQYCRVYRNAISWPFKFCIFLSPTAEKDYSQLIMKVSVFPLLLFWDEMSESLVSIITMFIKSAYHRIVEVDLLECSFVEQDLGLLMSWPQANNVPVLVAKKINNILGNSRKITASRLRDVIFTLRPVEYWCMELFFPMAELCTCRGLRGFSLPTSPDCWGPSEWQHSKWEYQPLLTVFCHLRIWWGSFSLFIQVTDV